MASGLMMRPALILAISMLSQAWMSELFAEWQHWKKHEKTWFPLYRGPFHGAHDPKISVGNCSIHIEITVFHAFAIPSWNCWMLKRIRCIGLWKGFIAALRPPRAALESPPAHVHAQGRVDTSFISPNTHLALSIPNCGKHLTEISRCVVIG